MRTAPRLLVTGLLAGLAVAQTDPKRLEVVLAQLQQDDSRAVAQAAQEARGMPQREVTSALQRTLHTWAKDDREHAEVVRLFLLDALVEHEARIPGDQLLPMLDEPRTEIPALVLLCREPAANEAMLLELFALRYNQPAAGRPAGGMASVTTDDPRRSLLGNVLCARRAKGFAAHLWTHANQALDVTVQDPAGGVQGSLSFQLPEVHPTEEVEGFPKLPVYRLDEQRPATDPTKRLLQDARAPKTLLTSWPTRIEFARGGAADMPLDLSWRGAQREAEWLALMAGETRDTMRGLRHFAVVHATDAQFVAEVTRARTQLEAAKKALRDTLVARGALSADEAKKCAVAVEVVVTDQRSERGKALPEVPAAR